MSSNVVVLHPVHRTPDAFGDCPFFQFVHNLTVQVVSDPERAKLVKSLTLEPYPRCEYPLLDTVHSSIECFINRSDYTVAERSSWVRDLQRSSMDALLAVLLPSLPRLERLEFKAPLSSPHCTRMLTNAMAAMSQGEKVIERPLQCLRHLGGPGPGTRSWADLYPHQLAHFLRLPSMESVAVRLYTVPERSRRRASRQITIRPSWELTTLESGSSNVASMELQTFLYNIQGIACAIAACRHLRRLKIQILSGLIRASEFAGLTAAVTQASSTLETLSLTHLEKDNHVYDFLRADPITSLHDNQCRIATTDFPKLRNLTLNTLSILGPRLLRYRMWPDSYPRPALDDGIAELLPECLPPQIERFHVLVWESADNTALICGIESLFQKVQGGRFGGLAHLRVDYPQYEVNRRETGTSYCHQGVEHLRDGAKDVGIQFESNLIKE